MSHLDKLKVEVGKDLWNFSLLFFSLETREFSPSHIPVRKPGDGRENIFGLPLISPWVLLYFHAAVKGSDNNDDNSHDEDYTFFSHLIEMNPEKDLAI